MNQYVYSFRTEASRGETFFRFTKFPEIISAIPTSEFRKLSQDEKDAHAADAVITALQARISGRRDIPNGDRPGAIQRGGQVALSVRQAMKLELYKTYLSSEADSVADLARKLGKAETLVRRLLDLRHPSSSQEIEDVIGALGKRLVHGWAVQTPLERAGTRSQGRYNQAAE
ncbi:hypothetical protein [uncultured Bradyrhizobium sp.]|uniref:hypothetical protein n=1 Tax=uncultured Bradyrhizobium sp. TaxID=199684 RepID=UPI0026070C57|nr:hypothetical protein [uncultured Bradyrhizobium sp.]